MLTCLMLRLAGALRQVSCQRRTGGLASGLEASHTSNRTLRRCIPCAKARREHHALAARRRDLLHGVRRRLWHGRHHPWRGLRPWNCHSSAYADSLERPHGVHGRRTRQRASRKKADTTPGFAAASEISGDFRKRGFRWSPASSIWRIYPTLFVAYLERLFPWFAAGHRGLIVGLAVVAVSAACEYRSASAWSALSSLWLFCAASRRRSP